MGLPELMVVHILVVPNDYIGHGPIDVCHGLGKTSFVTAEVQNINKVPFQKQKTNDSRDKISQSKRL